MACITASIKAVVVSITSFLNNKWCLPSYILSSNELIRHYFSEDFLISNLYNVSVQVSATQYKLFKTYMNAVDIRKA